jgi:hypothetical protein
MGVTLATGAPVANRQSRSGPAGLLSCRHRTLDGMNRHPLSPRLFHFSEDPSIEVFTPRPATVPAQRKGGRDWLNGPLVWAIEARRQAMYMFPRDCPRILLWLTLETTPEDLDLWWGNRACTAITHIEWAWFERLKTTPIHRYELPAEPFEDLNDAGMWVSRAPVAPLAMETLPDLPAALSAEGVELRLMESLVPLRGVWETSLHASGVRLRNAQGWGTPPDA